MVLQIPTVDLLGQLTIEQLERFLPRAEALLANTEQILAMKRAEAMQDKVETYRATCEANGLLYGFDLVRAEKLLNGKRFTAAEQKKLAQVREIEKKGLDAFEV